MGYSKYLKTIDSLGAATWHRVCNVGAVARWYEGMKYEGGTDEGPVGPEVFADVSHEAGNLAHKAYYWMALLEEDAGNPESSEAAGHVRDCLGELHGLVSRTMELLRPVKARPFLCPLDDLYGSLCVRFGTDSDGASDLLARVGAREVLVDPLQVDRAVGMLKEAFALRTGADTEADSLTLTLDIVPAAKDSATPVDTAKIVCCAKFVTQAIERDTVTSTIGAALAQKLLKVVGWGVTLDDDASFRTLTIQVPLSSPTDARNGSHDTDTSERHPA